MRLFVAVELGDPVRSVLGAVQSALARDCDGVRWIPARQLHLTLKFLGEVAKKDVSKVATAVQSAAGCSSKFDMKIDGCGCFPPRGPVRIVWAGITESSGALMQCAQSLEEGLEAIGFPKERRPFSPHLTIGRVRDDRSGGRIRDVVDNQQFEAPLQVVASITLMSSVLSPKGPTYAPVKTASLGND